MRKKVIVGNWKMNTTLADAYVLAQGVINEAEHLEHAQVVLCPPSVWLGLLAEHSIHSGQFSDLALGAQNMHFQPSGAFTGEISPTMVKEIAEYVILGHSERTHIFKEGIDLIAHKVKSAYEYGLTPILCVGEDVKEEKSSRQLVHKLNHLIAELNKEEIQKLIVAYEPVWAIGTGNPATPEYAEEVVSALRMVTSDSTRILYGGSVDENNAKGFLNLEDVDGLLIGGTSLKLKPFISICKYADDLVVQHNTDRYALDKIVKVNIEV